MYNNNYQKKSAKAKIPMYERSNWYDLSHAYTSYSYRKERAWDYCVHTMIEYNGMGLKVISRNTNFFTAGFLFRHCRAPKSHRIYCKTTCENIS